MKRIEVIDLRSEVGKEMIRFMDENIYHDTDSVKQYLNSVYGKGVESMRNDFIVLHIEERPFLFRKDAIIGIKKTTDGTAGIIVLTAGYMQYVDETYEEVVRKLFK